MRFYVAGTRSDLKNFLYQDCALRFLSFHCSFILSPFPSFPYFLLTKKMTRRNPLFGERCDEADRNHDFHTHHCLHIQHVWWRLWLPIPEHEYLRYYSVNRQEWHKTRRPVMSHGAMETFETGLASTIHSRLLWNLNYKKPACFYKWLVFGLLSVLPPPQLKNTSLLNESVLVDVAGTIQTTEARYFIYLRVVWPCIFLMK
jgi:hypothetical protein